MLVKKGSSKTWDYFGIWNFVKRHFGTDFLPCDTFTYPWDVPSLDVMARENFWHRGCFDRGTLGHWDISAWGFFGIMDVTAAVHIWTKHPQ